MPRRARGPHRAPSLPDHTAGRLAYQPALDGLRGVAVLAVMCFHSSISWARGGEFGVDLFFVLSGFLITTLLLQEWTQTSDIRLTDFWARRIRRLFPALLLVLVFVAAYALLVADPSTLSNLRWDGISSLTYWSNWWFLFSHQPYFAHFTTPSPLRHVWSLSVEEQWYVLWPPLLLVLLRATRGRTERLLPFLAALTAVSAGLMAVLASGADGIDRAYFGTDTRAQTLLVGSMLALVLHRWPVTRRSVRAGVQATGVVGAVVVAVMMIKVSGESHWMFRGGYTLFAVAGASVVAAAMMPRSGLVKRALRLWPLVAIGRMSYGLYLWHWPINVWLTPDRAHLTGHWLFVVRSVVAIAVAAASYHLIEVPIRSRRWQFRRPRLVTLQAGAVTAAVVVAATLVGPLHSPSASGSVNGASGAPTTTTPVTVTAPATTLPITVTTPPAPTNRKVRVMVVGDSVGWTLSWTMNDVPDVAMNDSARIACGLLPTARPVIDGRVDTEGSCQDQDQVWLKGLLSFQPDVVVMSYGAWEVYDQDVDGRTLKMYSAPYRRALLHQLGADVAFVARYSRARIALLDVPCFQEKDPRLGGPTSVRNDPRRGRWVQGVFDEVARRYRGRVAQIPIGQFLCPGGTFRKTLDGVILRPDGDHYSLDGAALTWRRWLGPRIVALARQPTLG